MASIVLREDRFSEYQQFSIVIVMASVVLPQGFYRGCHGPEFYCIGKVGVENSGTATSP